MIAIPTWAIWAIVAAVYVLITLAVAVFCGYRKCDYAMQLALLWPFAALLVAILTPLWIVHLFTMLGRSFAHEPLEIPDHQDAKKGLSDG